MGWLWTIGGALGVTILMRTFSSMNHPRIVGLVDLLPKHQWKRYGIRSLSTIRNLVIHHSASDGQSPYAIARFHVESKHLAADGAAGIAYHFYLAEDGTIYQTNKLETVSWHVRGKNTPSVGICLSGNLDKHPPTKAQLESLTSLLKSLRSKLPNTRIVQHRDLVNTSCAGKYFDIGPFKNL